MTYSPIWQRWRKSSTANHALSDYIYLGAGTPESVVTAPLGALYINTSGGADVCLYSKETGDGTDTGWIAVATA